MAKNFKDAARDANTPAADTIEFLRDFESLERNPNSDQTMTFTQLVEKKQELDAMEKLVEREKKWVGDQLLLALGCSGEERVKVLDGNYVLKVGNGRSASKIEPTKLLEQGVTVEQIQQATTEGKPYSFAQIIKVGE